MTDYRQWKTAISTKETDYETLLRLKNCGVDAMELSVPWQECDAIDWESFRKNADAAGIEIWSYHLPFSQKIHIASPDEKYRRRMVAYQCSMIEKAAAVGISRFIIHPSTEPISDKERPLQMAAAKKSLAELAQFAEEHGAVMCVEDLPRTCLGHTADEMLELISADSRLRVCFDVNHLFAEPIRDFIRNAGKHIITMHVTDNDGIVEKHWIPGEGVIDWQELFAELEKINYDSTMIAELGQVLSGFPDSVPKLVEAWEKLHK